MWGPAAYPWPVQSPFFARNTALIISLTILLSACLPYPDPVPTPTLIPADVRVVEAQVRGSYHTLLYQINAKAAREGWTAARHEDAAQLWLSLGDERQARPHLEAAAASDDPDVLRDLIALYIKLNRAQDALTQLDRLLALVPTDRSALYQSALLLLPFDPLRAQQRLQQVTLDVQYGESARSILKMMRETPPDDLWSGRVGALLAEQALWPYAEWAFVYAADHVPSPLAWAYAGLMRDAQGGDGSAYLDQAVALEPGSAQIQMALGLHRRQQGDLDGALAALQLALTLDPLNPMIHGELGTTYQQIGSVTEAQKWLQSAYTLSGGDVQYAQAINDVQALLQSGQIVPPLQDKAP